MPVVTWALSSAIIFATGVTSAAAVTGIIAAVNIAVIGAPCPRTISGEKYLETQRRGSND